MIHNAASDGAEDYLSTIRAAARTNRPRRLHDEAFEGHDRILNRYLKPDLLILDDMGMKHLPKKSGEFLFEIIMRRHELRSTMMTSNRPLEDWGKLIGDVPAATAILDRFLQNAELTQITGRSYRLRGRQADTQSRSAESTESDSAEPANGSSKTGQGTDQRLVRKPGRNTKATKNSSKYPANLNNTGRF